MASAIAFTSQSIDNMAAALDTSPVSTNAGAAGATSTTEPSHLATPASNGVHPSKAAQPMYSEELNSLNLEGTESPTMDIPSQIEGFIDLETLGKIAKSLSDSADADDIGLAEWITENYLYEPIGETEDGRPIRSREGFEKLDRAYKRVRSLTNRAQDKWPFFDRHWKKMPANTVRQVAQGFPALHGLQNKVAGTLQATSLSPVPTTSLTAKATANESAQGTTIPIKPLKAATIDFTKIAPSASENTTSSPVAEESMIDVDDQPMTSSDRLGCSPTAAEAEPVTTSLDAPPSFSAKRKRTRLGNGTFAGHSDQRKKQRGGVDSRGSRGGRGGGRSRLSEPIVADSDDDGIPPPKLQVDTSKHSARQTPDINLERKSPDSISTRRSKRQSTQLSEGEPEPRATQGTSQDTSEELLQPLVTKSGTMTHNEESPAVESDVASSSCVVKLKGLDPPTTQQPTKEDLLRLGILITSSRQSSSTPGVASTMTLANDTGAAQPTVSKPTTEDGSANTNGPSAPTIEFFARTHTPSGPLEIPISPGSLANMNKLTSSIHRYATWKHEDGKDMPVTFDQFHSIFMLDRPASSW